MTIFDDDDRYDAVGLAHLVRKGATMAGELLETAIARLEAVGPVINAGHPIVVRPTGPAVFGAIVSLRDGTGGTRRMRTFDFVVERDPDTGVYVGYVPGWPGAHTQGAVLNEVERNLLKVIEMLLEDGEPALESEFVGVRRIQVA